ncbi:hypothetical protein [Thermococcus sp. MAR1]|uniref:hypothetical protein n=1 Tax=Thermococcus sp. MAR1 TaxID=1638263 RepID=UPI00143C6BC7|nr:hypothetical protein [Thermococcus sp. MAR1]NJE09331.1 hypothetical protein [Thermococcus sp. MAR1]
MNWKYIIVIVAATLAVGFGLFVREKGVVPGATPPVPGSPANTPEEDFIGIWSRAEAIEKHTVVSYNLSVYDALQVDIYCKDKCELKNPFGMKIRLYDPASAGYLYIEADKIAIWTGAATTSGIGVRRPQWGSPEWNQLMNSYQYYKKRGELLIFLGGAKWSGRYLGENHIVLFAKPDGYHDVVNIAFVPVES